MIRRGKIRRKSFTFKKDENIFDTVEKIIFQSLKFLGILLLLLVGSGIFRIVLEILGFDVESMNSFVKILLSFCFDLLLLFLFCLIYHKTIKKDFTDYFLHDFKSHFEKSFKFWMIGIGLMILGNLIVIFFTRGNTISANEEVVREMMDKYPIYMLFQISIYAPITEELVFRKGIKDITHHKYLYIFLSGFIFGFLHVLSSVNQSMWFLYLIPYCSLGFLFAFLYYDTDNIFYTIVIHSLHNILSYLLHFIL